MAVRHQQEDLGFGGLLRQHRTVMGLSQEALAERAGLSTRAVSDLERGVKTRPHPATMRAIADALELGADARAELAAASRPSQPPPPRPPDDLPVPPSPIVGRTREIEACVDLLRSGNARLLTVTGPGGVGKTRLSLEIARGAADGFSDGSVFVELGALTDGSLVAPALATALKLRPADELPLIDAIRAHLQGKRTLIVLDNCEHLLDATRWLVSELLAGVPELRILATSRSSLRVRGEQLLPLEPFDVPGPDRAVALEELASIPAIELFAQRARDVRPDFALNEHNAPDIIEICARLDGLPLAIELAAIRMRALSPRALTSLLGERLRLLSTGPEDAPERHRTLRATVQWSHDLLASAQQDLFWKLAVFAGGCTIESVTEVAADGDPFAAVDGLEALVDQGLLRRTEYPDGEIRFVMLQTVRDFALELLREAPDADAVHARHAGYLVVLAERIGMHLHGPEPGVWLDRLEREQGNVRAALAWSLGEQGTSGDPVIALRLAAALWPFWHMRGRLHEGHGWLERAIAQGAQVDPATRAGAFLMLANIANNLEDHHQAASLYGESLRLCEGSGDTTGMARALVGLGLVATSLGDHDKAEDLLAQALDRYRGAASVEAEPVSCLYALGRLGIARGDYDRAHDVLNRARDLCPPDDVAGRTYLTLELAMIARLRGDFAEASRLAEACLTRFHAIGERRAEASTLAELGYIALEAGDIAGAGRQFGEAGARHLDVRDELGVVVCLEGYARLAAVTHQPELAATLIAAADTWRDRSGTQRTISEQHAVDRAIAEATEILGEPVLAEVWAAGSRLQLDQALAATSHLARSLSGTDPAARAGRTLGEQHAHQHDDRLISDRFHGE